MRQAFYVLYPKGVRTGGPEALHQLVHTMRHLGLDAYLVPADDTRDSAPVSEYVMYDAPERPTIEDRPGNGVIVPEIYWDRIKELDHATPYLWWLSIDSSPIFKEQRQLEIWERVTLSPKARIKRAMAILSKLPDRRYIKDPEIVHLAQSDYAHSFLSTRVGISASILSDYINMGDLPRVEVPGRSARTPQIAFNPAKGGEITQRIVAGSPKHLQWKPIVGMPRTEVVATLQNSAIYLDMGHHPGRDRMPREAAMCGALTLVANRGAGAFMGDVPIPNDHKISLQGDFIEETVIRILSMQSNLESEIQKQAFYRSIIRSSREQFVQEVSDIFVAGNRGKQTADYWTPPKF